MSTQMNSKNLINWLNTNYSVAYSLIRIFLGAALFIRGIIIGSQPDKLTLLAGSNQFYWWYSYITIIHITGGFLMTIGFFTRIASFIQLPILFVAVFFIHLHQELSISYQSLELSALVLFLLIVFTLFGSGNISIDYLITKRKLISSNKHE